MALRNDCREGRFLYHKLMLLEIRQLFMLYKDALGPSLFSCKSCT